MRYASREAAVQALVIDAIEATGEHDDAATSFDVEAISWSLIGRYDDGFDFHPHVHETLFWETVHRHERTLGGLQAKADNLASWCAERNIAYNQGVIETLIVTGQASLGVLVFRNLIELSGWTGPRELLWRSVFGPDKAGS